MNIIITGATKGIGRALCQRFAKEGFNLAICSRNSDDLKTFKAELQEQYPDIQILIKKCDVSKKRAVQQFAQFVLKKWDTIDVLVNNAGVFLPGEILQEEEGKLEKQIETNLYSAYYLSRAIAPNMLKQASGHIFNLCSIASIIAYPGGGSYTISKFALLGFSKVLREELKDKGVKVTSVLPGATWSASWSGVDLPVERLMPAADIAEAIWSASQMHPSTVVEEILLRPQLGDL
ncbi:MAG: SDR family oxidoreductase [Bacteroidota bacterium]